MKYKLVIFDLDNTLVLTKPAAKVGYKQAIYYLAKMNGLEKSRDKLYNHWKRIVQTLMGENKPHKRRFAYSLKQLMGEHQIPATYFQPALNLYEKEMLEHLRSGKGAKEMLSSLHEAEVKIAITTGSDRSEAIKKLKQVELYQYINLVITSADVGSMKPHPDFYKLAMVEFKVTPSESVVIGDSQKKDIDPAKSLKIDAFLVTPQTHLMEFKPKLL